MLKRSKRISGRDTVEEIIKEGARTSSPFFVSIRKPGLAAHTRYAVLVGKKIERSASKRNKKRRQIYEILRLLEQTNSVPSTTPFDIVLMVRQASLTAPFGELQAALLAQLRRS